MSARETILAAAVCVAATALVLFEALFLGRSTLAFGDRDPRIDMRPWVQAADGPLQPINPITPDTDVYILPGMMRAEGLNDAGHGFAWDDTQLCGAPFAANLSWPVWSPLGWLVRALPPVTAMDVMLLLHLAVGAFLAYRLCRMLDVGASAAAFAAVGFAGSAWMYTHWHASPILWSSVWWPGQLAAVVLITRGQTRAGVVQGGLFTGMALVAGFPQVGLVTTAGAIGVALLDRRCWSVRRLAALGAMGAIGVALAAPQMLPSASAFEQSLRASEETRAATARRGLEPGALFGFALPEFFGRPSDFMSDDPPAPSFESWVPNEEFLGDPLQNNPVENAMYPGAAVLMLLLFAGRRGRSAWGRRFLLVGLLAVAAAWAGPHLVAMWDGFARLGAGSVKRVLAVAGGAWPFAAAFVLDAVVRRERKLAGVTPLAVIAALIAVPWLMARIDHPDAAAFATSVGGQVVRQSGFLLLAWAGIALARRGRLLAFLPAVVLLLDLGLMARAFNPFPAETPPFVRTAAIAALAERPGRSIIMAERPNLVPGPTGAVHGLRSAIGMLPMVPRRTAELLECIEGPLFDRRDPRVSETFKDVASLGHPVLDLLGVDTVLISDPSLVERSGLAVAFATPEEGIGGLARETALPRSFLVGGAEVVTDPEARLSRLRDRGFDPRSVVLLERAPGVELPATGAWVAPITAAHEVIRHELEFDAPYPGIAVLSESWDPGWSATVNGAPAEILIADHALLAVALPAGEHVVRFEYEEPGGFTGRVLATIALLVLIALVAVPWTGLLRSHRERSALA